LNRIILTGKVRENTRVFFTPKGEKIALIPVEVEDFNTVEVMYLDNERKIREENLKGKKIMVLGILVKSERKNGGTLRIKAKKIEFMEE
jgi:primosomal replication protein N